MTTHFKPNIVAVTAIVAALVIIFLRTPVHAGPLTGSAGNPPFTKLGVYQGVVSVVSSGTNIGLELGNLGSDIAGTSDIYLRPGALGHASGLSITRNGNSADIHLSGNLCLYHHVGGVIPSPFTPDCRNIWPGGGATSNWNLVSNVNDFFNNQNGNALQPKSLNYAVHVGSLASPVTGGTAVTLNGIGFGDLDVVNTAGGAAITTQGKLVFNQSASILKGLYINGQQVFYPDPTGQSCDVIHFPGLCNEGIGSGLDADLLNGNNVTLENATACADDGGLPRAACICFYINRAGSITKHCAALRNE